MKNPRLEKLKKLIEVTNEGTLTLTEAKKLVQLLIERVKNDIEVTKNDLKSEVSKEKQELEKQLNKAISSLTATEKKLVESDKHTKKVINEVNPMIRQAFREIDDLKKEIPELPDLSRHITVDNIKEFLPEIPEQVRDKLETLKDDERLDKSAIKGIEEDIKRLDEKIASIPRGLGGGVTNLRIQQAFKYILKTEAPVGNIDGVNLEYTVSQTIFAVLAFSLNGEVIPQIPNYTISGNKITFSTALPSAYSGKDFEIKYI